MNQAIAAAADVVLAERHGPVLVLTFNRPHRLNAWTDDLQDRYFALLSMAEADPDVRAIAIQLRLPEEPVIDESVAP